MNLVSIIHKAGRLFATLCILIALAGLLFRATLYWTFPVHPGDPYGLGDVIELAMYMLLLCVAGVSVGLSVLVSTIPKFRNVRLAAAVLLCAVLSWAAYYFLIGYVPRLM